MKRNDGKTRGFEFMAKKGETSPAELHIYDDIGGWGETAQFFRWRMSLINKSRDLDIYINSNGGSVYHGFAIYSMIKRHKGKVTVYVDGMCASIATVIALAGDEVVMSDNSAFMIHNAWARIVGDYKTLMHRAKLLKSLTDSIRDTYVRKTGKDVTEIEEAMDAETQYSPTEALKNGFIDRIENWSNAKYDEFKPCASRDKSDIDPKDEEIPDDLMSLLEETFNLNEQEFSMTFEDMKALSSEELAKVSPEDLNKLSDEQRVELGLEVKASTEDETVVAKTEDEIRAELRAEMEAEAQAQIEADEVEAQAKLEADEAKRLEEEALAKADKDEIMAKFEAEKKEKEEMMARLEELEAEKAQDVMNKRKEACDDVLNSCSDIIGESNEDVQNALMSIHEVDPKAFATVSALLKDAMNTIQNADKLEPQGTSGGKAVGDDCPYNSIQECADALIAEAKAKGETLTNAKARIKAVKTFPVLYVNSK